MFSLGYIQFVSVLLSFVVGSNYVGGWQDTKPANQKVQTLLKKAKTDIEAAAGEKYKTMEAVSYRTQLVNGWNYLIKAKVQTEGSQKEEYQYIHVKIWKRFDNRMKVLKVEKNKSRNDNLSIT